MLLEAALRQIDADLTRAHVSFALVGGLAVSARTEPRFTRDADFAVALASDAEAEALIHELRTHDYDIEAVVEQEAVGRLATVRLTRSGELQPPVIDLLFASSGIEREVVAEAEPLELLPNLTIGVARTGHLIALKVLSRDDVRRPQDLVDLRALLRIASPAELARARDSLTLISARGYHRGRDLVSEMSPLAMSYGCKPVRKRRAVRRPSGKRS
jgi:predicted nucleotidyltransferase